MEKDLLTEKIIGCCFRVHNELGAGFVEKVYHNALKIVFDEENIKYNSEKSFDVLFQEVLIGKFRCDFFIEEKMILEIKSYTGNMPILFRNQVISYLRASKVKTALLVNFGNKSCEVKRISV
jgi:GxxExxY protein